jgi:hypothetical protein
MDVNDGDRAGRVVKDASGNGTQQPRGHPNGHHIAAGLVPAGSSIKLQIQVSETLAVLRTLTRVAQRLDHV